MPFALLIIGALLLVASIRNTQDELFTLVKGDLTGANNFVYWMVAILLIGVIGYIPKLKPVSVAFLASVIIVLFLKRGNPSGIGGGFFSQFTTALGTTQSQPVTNVASTVGAPNSFGLPSLPNLNTILQ